MKANVMFVRVALATLVLGSLLTIPSPARAAIVQKWATAAGATYRVLQRLGDWNGDGVYDLLTSETSGTNARIAIRSGATGALMAQTALAYKMGDLRLTDLDSDGIPEIILLDLNSGHYICFNWTTGSSTLAVRWTSTATFNGAARTAFVDFDGNGHLYSVFMLPGAASFFVYDRNGALVNQVTIPGSPNTSVVHFTVTDVNLDQKEDLVIDFQHAIVNPSDYNSSQGGFWVYQSSNAADVGPGASDLHAFRLSPSYPNPAASVSRVDFSMPKPGPVSLRLFDVSGREVRTLVDGPEAAGQHSAAWDGRDAQGRQLPAGAYFYELNAGGQRATRRVVRIP